MLAAELMDWTRHERARQTRGSVLHATRGRSRVCLWCYYGVGVVVRRAARRDEAEPDIVEALTDAGAVVTRLSQEGIPDLLILHPSGVFMLFEVKTGKGKLTKAQKEFNAANSKGPLAVVRTPAEAVGAMRSLV